MLMKDSIGEWIKRHIKPCFHNVPFFLMDFHSFLFVSLFVFLFFLLFV